MFKKIICLFCLSVSFCLANTTQVKFDIRDISSLDDPKSSIFFCFVDKDFTKYWGLSFISKAGLGYGEAFIGPSFSYKSLKLIAYTGLETLPERWRFGGAVKVSYKRMFFSALYEYGSGMDYGSSFLLFKLNDFLSLDAKAWWLKKEPISGFGLLFQKWKLYGSLVPLYNFTTKKPGFETVIGFKP